MAVEPHEYGIERLAERRECCWKGKDTDIFYMDKWFMFNCVNNDTLSFPVRGANGLLLGVISFLSLPGELKTEQENIARQIGRNRTTARPPDAARRNAKGLSG